MAKRKNSLEDNFRLAVEAAPNGMLMMDQRGKIIFSNSAAEKLFGYAKGGLFGLAVEDLIPKRMRGKHEKHRARYAEIPSARAMGGNRDLIGLRQDGTEIPVEIGLTPVELPEGPAVLASIIDISERKQLEQRRRELVSTMNHDLKNPLTSILSIGYLLKDGLGGKLNKEGRNLLELSQKNCQRMIDLIDDFLSEERLESGRIEYHTEPVEVGAFLQEIAASSRLFALGFGVEVSLRDGKGAGKVLADPVRLHQVLLNLVSNAVKFSKKGGKVSLGVEKKGKSVRILVVDHGRGIPDEFRRHIFQRFSQAKAEDAAFKGGSGLGLSIVKEMVDKMGGTIGYRSQPDVETVFFIDLPKAD